jgi:hypothetical protein
MGDWRVWERRQARMAYFKILAEILLNITEESEENFSKDIQYHRKSQTGIVRG